MDRIAAAAALALIALSSGGAAHQKQHGHLKIVHPFTMETAAGATETRVMMTISNVDGGADALVSVSTPVAGTALVHPAVSGQPTRIAVPSNGKVELTAASAHIVLKGLRKRLVGYDRFPMTLVFEKSGAVDVDVMVEERE